MRIVKMEANPSGSHEFRFAKHITTVPDGWAMIPDGFEVPDTFPFVSIEAEEKTHHRAVMVAPGVMEQRPFTAMTVTSMTAGEVPTAPVPEPTAEEDTAAMLIDHEYRLTLLELGLSE